MQVSKLCPLPPEEHYLQNDMNKREDPQSYNHQHAIIHVILSVPGDLSLDTGVVC